MKNLFSYLRKTPVPGPEMESSSSEGDGVKDGKTGTTLFIRIYKKISSGTIVLIQEFVNGSTRVKIKILSLPALTILAIFVINYLIFILTPPEITSVFPSDKSIDIEQTIKIEMSFSRAVNRSSVENNFFLSPPVSGKFEWLNDKSFIFAPSSSLTRGVTYALGFRKPFSSTYSIQGQKNVSSTFTVIGNSRIVFKAPEIEAPDSRTPITVIFSQPMRSLTTATASAAREEIFKIMPPVPGSGKWVGTTAYQYTPTNNYRQATTYTVSVNSDLISVDGIKLDQEYTWSFSGARPRVVRTGPEVNTYDGAGTILPVASISAYFNLKPDPNIDPSNFFEIKDSLGKPVEGNIVRQANALHFVPFNNFKRGGYYTAVVKKGLTVTEGPNGTEDDYLWNISILPELTVQSTYPNQNGVNEERDADIFITFNAPLTKDSVIAKNFTVNPPLVTDPKTDFVTCEITCDRITLHGKLKRLTTYSIIINKNIKDIYGSSLNNDYHFSFNTGPKKTDISFVPSSLQIVIVNQAMPIEIFSRTINASKVTYTLYKITESDFLTAERASYNYGNNANFLPQISQKIKNWSVPIKQVPDEYVKQSAIITDAKSNRLEPGYYHLTASIEDGKSVSVTFLHTKSTLTVKEGADKMLVWSTDQSNGQTISDMKIRLIDAFGKILDEASTNSDGIAYLKTPDIKNFPESDKNLFVIGTKDNDVTITGTRWSYGINNYSFGLPYYSYHEDVDYPTYIVLDRPLYRPGQEVLYKGLIRKDTDGAFETIKAGENVEVTITDANGRKIYSEKKQLTGFGTFSGKLKLSPDGNVGLYAITTKYNNEKKEFSRTFQVEEYKRQDFKVSIKQDKNDFISGENLKFRINASYYFGAPIKNVSTFYTVKTEDYFFRWDQNPQYEFGQPDSYWYRPWSEESSSSDKSLVEVNAVTNNKGDIEVSLPVDMSQEKQSKRIVVDAAVTDMNNRTVGASEEIFMHKSGVYVGVKPRDYVGNAGSQTLIDTVTLDPLGNPVQNRKVKMEFIKITWVSAREEDPSDGSFHYRNKAVETSVASTEIQTNDKGLGSGGFIPDEGGTYKVVASTSDNQGNTMASNTYFWVSGSNFESTRENHDRIPLVTDKYQYERGENAKLFISTPFGADVAKTLITFERNNILDYKVINVDEKNITYEFPVTEKMVPNVYLSAVLVRGSNSPKKPPEFKIGYTELRVADMSKKLQVAITTDKNKYSPRDTVKTSIDVRDAKGNKREAELSLALVDRSLLDLASVTYPEPYNFFFEPRGLGINTSQSLTFSLNRINVSVTSDSKGGDGTEQSRLSTKRKYFPETDYWNAHIVTDKNGHAEINIPLADNLTTWKFTAIANTSEDAFGMGKKEIVATKEVLLRAVTPRFLAISDQAKIGAILVNNGEVDLSVDVSLKATGVTTKDKLTQRIQIPKGQQINVLWDVTASQTEKATINVIAKTESGKVMDDLEVEIPVVQYHTPETTATAGNVDNQKTETVNIPKDVVKNIGSLDITLSSSILGSTINALSYLIGYPYGCIEQTASRFYAAIPLYSLMKTDNIKNVGIYSQDDLKNVINLGIQKLQNEQKTDGGWGWWVESSDSDPFLSAYAMLALTEAKAAGLGVSDLTITNGESYLTGQLNRNRDLSLDTQSYILRVLKNPKNSVLTGYIDNLYANRSQLSIEGKAYLLTSMYKHDYSKNMQTKLKDELMSLMRKTAAGVHWEDKKESAYSIMGNSTSATAAILETLLLVDPSSPLLGDIARYFQANLRESSWLTTRTTSAVLHSLVTYTKNRSDFGANYKYTTTLNGKLWQNGSITKDDMGGIIKMSKPLSGLKTNSPIPVVYTKKGNGNLYYTMNLRYFLPYTQMAQLEQGITVIREYEDNDGNLITGNYIKAGSMLRVKLTIVVNDTRHKVVVEDRLPAGLEANNENLKGSIATAYSDKRPSLGTYPLYYVRKEYRDDRVVYFTDILTPGVYETSYYAHATTLGKYHRPPAQAYEMYMPDVMGHTDGGWFEVVN
ncbi:MAG: Ig-like domain-containing protein [Candidatus Levybacteria bacterium]|nr:Ig-like domain-containing protein [Candidatus Levybacteria bacterium]